MTDVLDLTEQREAQVLALRLDKCRQTALSDDEIAQIIQAGRDCCECGLPIPAQRLRVQPFAVRCIDCQQDYENKR